MAASHVVKCRGFCFIIDINRIYTITRIFSNENVNTLPRLTHCRYLFTSKDEVRWSSQKNAPRKNCHNTSSHDVEKDSLYNGSWDMRKTAKITI
ncbi:UNVERIFIED_CONTAM: hypothetical protein PYX00_008872 [Menopon gallinae]|uniref:Uncharacterized protein n=1 Tax=Menopon gallinae TaxID=328185 RepID=A0AAW2H973_9NEOP